MGMNSVGGGNQSMNVLNSKTASPETLNAAKKKMQEAQANQFEGYKKIEPNNFKDDSQMSEQSASISKNLKDATQEIKEMLKNPNAFTDCFPSIPKGPKNQIETGGAKPPLSGEQMEAKLKAMAEAAQNTSTLTPLTPDQASQMQDSLKRMK